MPLSIAFALQVLYRNVQLRQWNQREQAAAAAQAAAADQGTGGAPPDAAAQATTGGAADVVEHTIALPADPVAPLDALNTTVGPRAAMHRGQQRRDQQRLYFTLTRATGRPLSIDQERSLEVSSPSLVRRGA